MVKLFIEHGKWFASFLTRNFIYLVVVIYWLTGHIVREENQIQGQSPLNLEILKIEIEYFKPKINFKVIDILYPIVPLLTA